MHYGLGLVCGQTRDDVIVHLAHRIPFSAAEFGVFQGNSPFVVAERSAVEQPEHLVAFTVVGRPVHDEQALRLAVEVEFLA